MLVCVPTEPELYLDDTVISAKRLAGDIAFEREEIERYEKMMRAHRPWRRHWPRRRYESVALLSLMAPDEGIVNQDALV